MWASHNICAFLQVTETGRNIKQEEHSGQYIKEEIPHGEIDDTSTFISKVRWSCRLFFFYKNTEELSLTN